MNNIKLQGHVWTNGHPLQLVKVEINGPATYSMWRASYIVYMNCLVMLDAVDLGKLLAYMRKQDSYYEKYGSRAWALQYQIEVRTRSEHFLRVRRDILSDDENELAKHIEWYGLRAKALK